MIFGKNPCVVVMAALCLMGQSIDASASDRQTRDLLAGATIIHNKSQSSLSNSESTLSQAGLALDKHLSTLKDGALAQNGERLRGEADSKIFGDALPGVVLVLTENAFSYGTGSGSLISEDGLILTNYHVIDDAKSMMVVFHPEQGMIGSQMDILESSMFYPAQVVRVDEYSDLALIRIGGVPSTAKVLELATEDTKPAVGDDVHALGHPRGQYWTYTRGYISQVREKFEWGPFQDGDPPNLANVIQTQTPINPGNSGGPLLNQQGKIVGVNSFGSGNSEGLNFAVALSSIHEFLKREDDRLFPEQEPAQQPEPVYIEFDTNKNGVVDLVSEDVNRNEIPESYYLDLDEDGEADIILWDGNENGFAEWRGSKKPVSGVEVFVWEIDTNENGTIDRIGIDVDLDGVVDRFEPV